MNATVPTRPADLPHTASLRELVEAYHGHVRPLVDSRYRIGSPLTDEQAARHAIGALAVSHALAGRVLAGRWVTACDALAYGADVEAVAAAMELSVAALRAGLTGWADGQRNLGLMGAAGHDEVVRLAAGPTAGPERVGDEINSPAEGDGQGGSR